MSEPHNEYFIEKEQLPVEVTLVTGEELRGCLFVQPNWRKASVEFDALVLLNLPDSYFPLQLADGSTRLISKGHVVLLRGGATEADGEQLGDPAPVVVRCTNGVVVQGNLMLTRVSPSVRVLDYLNRSVEEFILLHEGSRMVLVNRRHVVLVQDETNGAA
jgi:hypothetical protein